MVSRRIIVEAPVTARTIICIFLLQLTVAKLTGGVLFLLGLVAQWLLPLWRLRLVFGY